MTQLLPGTGKREGGDGKTSTSCGNAKSKTWKNLQQMKWDVVTSYREESEGIRGRIHLYPVAGRTIGALLVAYYNEWLVRLAGLANSSNEFQAC